MRTHVCNYEINNTWITYWESLKYKTDLDILLIEGICSTYVLSNKIFNEDMPYLFSYCRPYAFILLIDIPEKIVVINH